MSLDKKVPSFAFTVGSGWSVGAACGLIEGWLLKPQSETVVGGGDPWVVLEATLIYGVLGIIFGIAWRVIARRTLSPANSISFPLTCFGFLITIYSSKHHWPAISNTLSIGFILALVLAALVFFIAYRLLTRWISKSGISSHGVLWFGSITAACLILSLVKSPLFQHV